MSILCAAKKHFKSILTYLFQNLEDDELMGPDKQAGRQTDRQTHYNQKITTFFPVSQSVSLQYVDRQTAEDIRA